MAIQVTFGVGIAQAWTAPSWVTSITIDMVGAQGGPGSGTGVIGFGARIQTTLPVTPNATYIISVGGAGGTCDFGNSGLGYNGAGTNGGGPGHARYTGGGALEEASGGGGGYTAFGTAYPHTTLNTLLCAGGGGGSAGWSGFWGWSSGGGGGGGWVSGGAGNGNGGSGGAGTGISSTGTNGGVNNVGGSPTNGGGGGDYPHGFSGGGGGGGGATSYADPSATGLIQTGNYNAANGSFTLSYDLFTPQISVGEDITVSEGIAAASQTNLFIFDSITVSESMSLYPINLVVDVFDSVSASPVLFFFGIPILFINVFDAITVSEDINAYSNIIRKTFNENVTVSENISLYITVLKLSVFDTVTVSEDPRTDGPVLQFHVFDIVAVNDQPTNFQFPVISGSLPSSRPVGTL